MANPSASSPSPNSPSPGSPEAKPSWLRRGALGCGVLLALAAVGLFVLLRVLDRPLPDATPGADAEALAREMAAAADVDAWNRTGAIAWDFGGRQQHLWDRHRELARVRWDGGRQEALIDLSTQQGRAYVAGEEGTAYEEVTGPEAAAMVEAAWAFWCNDSFWLNPVAKLFDEGTERALVTESHPGTAESERGLLVTYTAGGVTPGDSYLWWVGDDGLPRRWQMWTRILPLGGVEASWDGWIELPTGARVATRHATPVFELELSDIQAADSLDALAADGRVQGLTPGVDPFAPLTGGP